MAEKEYIEREKALDAISEWLMKALHTENMSSYNEGERDAYRTSLSEIANLPAADVRPVAKAHWVYTDRSRLVCSNCGNPVAFALKDDGWHHGDFCPNCGAMMEES